MSRPGAKPGHLAKRVKAIKEMFIGSPDDESIGLSIAVVPDSVFGLGAKLQSECVCI